MLPGKRGGAGAASSLESTMGLVQHIYRAIKGCAVVGHVPDRRRVRREKGDLRTVCRRCRASLVRYGPEDWRLDDDR